MPEFLTAPCMRKLPPLILHPFSDASSPGKLLEGSKASLMLQGILPNDTDSVDHLENLLLEGRVCEIRMLYYVGKDLLRWIEQCIDFVERDRDVDPDMLRAQTFASYLVDHAPEPVRIKLTNWGVQDYRSIFSRAIGFNSVFGDAPVRNQLAEHFIRHYHVYADSMYALWMKAQSYKQLTARSFDFDLYASAEYSRLLEQQWTEDEEE